MATKEELLKDLAFAVKFLKEELKKDGKPHQQTEISVKMGLGEGTLGKILKGHNDASPETLEKHLSHLKALYSEYFSIRKYDDTRLDMDLKVIHSHLAVIENRLAILAHKQDPRRSVQEHIQELLDEVAVASVREDDRGAQPRKV